ncbi:hypothetical protein HPULCUR_003403 [Helicostylum pulchrum]|uniref:Adhesin domain-containing protein n=1 Tax=Helicostylum pulchrum TaxID=562976 RepID=A0ABP9XUN0_9FUNG
MPLLPTTTEECQRLECYKNRVFKSKYRRQMFLFVLLIILFSVQNGYHQDIYNSIFSDAPVQAMETVQDLVTTSDILAFNQNQISSQANLGCNVRPFIPYSGLSKFEFNPSQFPELSVKQKTNQNRGKSISISGGETTVLEDKRISKVIVEFDLKFNNEELQHIYWIEKEESTANGLYALTIRSDGSYIENACVTIGITIRVPNAKSLEVLDISLANSGVTLKKGLTFDQVAVAVANGYVDFSEGITSGQTAFVVANGHISGVIDTLSDELHVSIANGHTDIAIKNIKPLTQATIIPLDLRAANGHVKLKVPSNFDSTFSLKSYTGRRTVESSIPQKIHRKSNRWGETSGYYGNNEHTKNSIRLSVSNGSLQLTYV